MDLSQLRKKGYQVIPNVLSEKECDQFISQLWDWLEGLDTGIRRKDPKTWHRDNWPISSRGIIHQYGAGHLQPVWDIRTHPNVIKAFEKIWKTDELLVSFDGLCIMKPGKYASYNQKSWYHTDQSSKKIGKHCIQGFVTLETVSEEDGSLMVYENSHRYHQKMFERNGVVTKIDWHKLSPDDLTWLESKRSVKEKRVTASKGSLVLWDSRTIHCNAPPFKNQTVPRFRYVVYVCMTPRRLASEWQLTKKQTAFNDQRTTSHWPHQIRVFPKKPHTYGKPVPPYVMPGKPVMTKRGEQLAGLIPYDTKQSKPGSKSKPDPKEQVERID